MTAEPIAPVPGPVQAPVPARKDRGTQLLLLLAGLVAVAGIAFAVGRVTAPTPAAAATGRFGNGNFGAGFANGAGASGAPGAGLGRGLFGGGAGAGATVRGTVQSVTPTSITLKLADGQTATIDLTGSTTYHRQAAASSTDVAPGAQVQVQVAFQPRAAGSTPAPSGAPRTFTATDVTLASQ